MNKLYDNLKQASKDTNYAVLFQVDEMVNEVENIEAIEGYQNEVTQFFKHSNQQNKIIEIMIKEGLILEK